MNFYFGQTIGIIGNGQLARMMAISAYNLGFKVAIYGEDDNGPANLVTKFNIIGKYNDYEKLLEFVKSVDFVTYEFENIDVENLKKVEAEFSNKIFPNSNALYISKNRIREKNFFNELSIKTGDYWVINSIDDLRRIVFENEGSEFILKTAENGYDGKGQFKIKNSYDLADINLEIQDMQPGDYILEKKVNFTKEASIIIACDKNNNIESFPIPENIHINGILHSSFVPNNLSEKTNQIIREIGEKVIVALNYIGVLAIEFFINSDGNVIANEMAPRVHNTGHYTMNSCNISQFEAHIRAITGLNLKKVQLLNPCKMRNLIGEDVKYFKDFVDLENAYLHIYGKEDVKNGRKMGHVNMLQQKNDYHLYDDDDDENDEITEEFWNEDLLNSLIGRK